MENNILLNNITVKAEKQLVKIQKEFLKDVKKSVKISFKNDKAQKKLCLKSQNVKARIGKFVKLNTQGESYIDLSNGAHSPSPEKCEKATSAFNDASSKFSPDVRTNLLSFIAEKNIVGMSGDCFPLAKKLETALDSSSARLILNNQRVLIVNAIECEPSLLHDDWLLQNRGEQIARAISLVASTGFDKVVIAAKPPVNVTKIGKYDVTYVAPVYPMGSEHVLIRELFGVEILATEIPADYGIAVVNIQTLFSFYESVMTSKPVQGRFITVADLTNLSGAKTGNALIVYAPYGMKITEVFNKTIAKTKESDSATNTELVTGGGLLFGHIAATVEVVAEGTCFIGRIKKITRFDNNAKCKGCMKCSKSCPMGLKVTKISHNVRVGDISKAKTFEPQKCIQCGTCSFVCGASKNLMEVIKKAKE